MLPTSAEVIILAVDYVFPPIKDLPVRVLNRVWDRGFILVDQVPAGEKHCENHYQKKQKYRARF
jgi:hypothetical protein